MKARLFTLLAVLSVGLAALSSCSDAIYATIETERKVTTNTLPLLMSIFDIEATIPGRLRPMPLRPGPSSRACSRDRAELFRGRPASITPPVPSIRRARRCATPWHSMARLCGVGSLPPAARFPVPVDRRDVLLRRRARQSQTSNADRRRAGNASQVRGPRFSSSAAPQHNLASDYVFQLDTFKALRYPPGHYRSCQVSQSRLQALHSTAQTTGSPQAPRSTRQPRRMWGARTSLPRPPVLELTQSTACSRRHCPRASSSC